MKYTSVLNSGKASIGRHVSREAARRTQLRAADLCEIDGDLAEAKRRRDAAIDLQRKPFSFDLYELPKWLLDDLGGGNDPIVRMVRRKAIDILQAKCALFLREHHQGITLSLSRDGVQIYVDRQPLGGLEGLTDARRKGAMAWNVALNAIEQREALPVRWLILGGARPKALRQYGGDIHEARAVLDLSTSKALEAASAYIGA
jgi:hypothetical protein